MTASCSSLGAPMRDAREVVQIAAPRRDGTPCLDVWSQCLMVHSSRGSGRMRYGPRFATAAPPLTIPPRKRGVTLHFATTTAAICRAIQHSQESLRDLGKRYGINTKTVARWRSRSSVQDRSTGPKQAQSTALSAEDEAVVVAFRRHTSCRWITACMPFRPTSRT